MKGITISNDLYEQVMKFKEMKLSKDISNE